MAKTLTKPKTVFACQQCGYQSPKWVGRCPDCEGWNTLVEERMERLTTASLAPPAEAELPKRLAEIAFHEKQRWHTGIDELDRVLGGGIVPGSVVLLGGEPGIGKSTLLLWMAGRLGSEEQSVLYVSGEESLQQTKLRAHRLGTDSPHLYLLSETQLQVIVQAIERLHPQILIMDSVQVLYRADLTSSPGSVSQVRECSTELVRIAKSTGMAVIMVGHVTKDGSLAGPKVLEHIVDTVLAFEGDRHSGFRILRASKNRFGATSEIGVFQMTAQGLEAVANPSEFFIAERPTDAPGSMVTAAIEGNRPLLVELQALACATHFGLPRRRATGVDINRLQMLTAVLEKRVGLGRLSTYDVYVSASGGAKVLEPAADLAMALAIASSIKERPLPAQTMACGEVGLAGEVRSAIALERRLQEAQRLGFTQGIVSHHQARRLRVPGLTIIGVGTVRDAVDHLLGR